MLAPLKRPPLATGRPLRNHWYVSGAVPVALTLMATVWPPYTEIDGGSAETVGCTQLQGPDAKGPFRNGVYSARPSPIWSSPSKMRASIEGALVEPHQLLATVRDDPPMSSRFQTVLPRMSLHCTEAGWPSRRRPTPLLVITHRCMTLGA